MLWEDQDTRNGLHETGSNTFSLSRIKIHMETAESRASPHVLSQSQARCRDRNPDRSTVETFHGNDTRLAILISHLLTISPSIIVLAQNFDTLANRHLELIRERRDVRPNNDECLQLR